MRISDWSSDVCSSDLRFFNPDGGEDFTVPKGRSRGGVLARWFLGADERPEWPESVAVQPSKPQMNVQSGEMKAVWVGHATVLVQAGGLNNLPDTIWQDYASPFPPLGTARVTQPGIRESGRAHVRTPVNNAQLVCR